MTVNDGWAQDGPEMNSQELFNGYRQTFSALNNSKITTCQEFCSKLIQYFPAMPRSAARRAPSHRDGTCTHVAPLAESRVAFLKAVNCHISIDLVSF
jgi:hypothetical protein